MDDPCVLLPWDTEFFGFPVARITASSLKREAVPSILDWARGRRVQCLYFLANPDTAETGEAAAEAGFRFADLRLELSLKEPLARPVECAKVECRKAKPVDVPRLAEIARDAHTDSRFFFDRQFGSDAARALFAKWIELDCAGRASAVWVADDGKGVPLGYASCTFDKNHRQGHIGLFGVHAEYGGRGIGRALLKAALSWISTEGVGEVRVVTQGRNVAAQRLYQAFGFRTWDSGVWYHRWF
jgi:dTDP-4-amino-4,6-dideoxy-D-galactose acyltransferase